MRGPTRPRYADQKQGKQDTGLYKGRAGVIARPGLFLFCLVLNNINCFL